MRRRWIVVVGSVALATGLGLLLWRDAPSASDVEVARTPALTTPPAEFVAVASVGAAARVVPVRSAAPDAALPSPRVRANEGGSGEPEFADEPALMAALDELGETDPELSLRWAREGEARYSGSEAAPQRAWILVKSLANLGRLEEAREEARVFVEKYRDTPQALDLERHLLVHPFGPPEGANH